MVYLAEILYGARKGAGFQIYQNENQSIEELGHSDLLPVYDPNLAKSLNKTVSELSLHEAIYIFHKLTIPKCIFHSLFITTY